MCFGLALDIVFTPVGVEVACMAGAGRGRRVLGKNLGSVGLRQNLGSAGFRADLRENMGFRVHGT